MKEDKKQEQFLKSVLDGKNIFLTGNAGTGKSHIVKKAMEELRNEGKNVVAIAPTGIAAYNINGQTIHSMFALPIHGILEFKDCKFLKEMKRVLMKNIDVIFIDEVSMLRPDILDGINWTLLKNGCKSLNEKQIVFIGDLKQLQAPLDDNAKSVLLQHYDGIEFYNANIYNDLNVEQIELDTIHRQTDLEFIEKLNIIRNGGKDQYFRKFLSNESKGIILAPHNETVKKHNQKGMESIEGKEYIYKAKIDGNVKASDFNVEPLITLKDGCKIMYLVNSKENPLINGTTGIFRIKENKPYIEVDGNKWLIEEMEFEKKEYIFNRYKKEMELETIGSITQIPVKLAYALTIHKSQGLTFDEVTVDLSRSCFAHGQLYTALSRVKTPNGLNILIK